MTGIDEQAAAEAFVSLTGTLAHRENQTIATATMINKARFLASRFSLLAIVGFSSCVGDAVSNVLRNSLRR